MPLSEYELLRLQNIARNQEALKELELERIAPSLNRRKPRKKAKSLDPLPERPIRSARLRQLPPPPVPGEPAELIPKKSKVPKDSLTTSKQASQESANPASSKFATVDVDRLVPYIGQLIPGQPKEAAMRLAAGRRVVFGRMSGVQPFANLTALFVNVGGVDYQNVFTKREGKLFITWFAQPSQSEQTARRIAAGAILFIRTTGQYVYAGPLRMVEMNFDKRPFEFLWEIVSASTLEKSPDFQTILNYEAE